jgi:hypothetical protein
MAETVLARQRRTRFGLTGTAVACVVGCCAVPAVAGLGIGAVAGCAALLLGASVLVVAAVGATRALGGQRVLRRRGRSVGPIPIALMHSPAARGAGASTDPTHTPLASARHRPLQTWFAVLLVAWAALFAIGVAVERSHHTDHHPVATGVAHFGAAVLGLRLRVAL